MERNAIIIPDVRNIENPLRIQFNLIVIKASVYRYGKKKNVYTRFSVTTQRYRITRCSRCFFFKLFIRYRRKNHTVIIQQSVFNIYFFLFSNENILFNTNELRFKYFARLIYCDS